ncbi:uncharacterized protein LOC129228639 [Uloborus diversus]|uniref:uncharacterized protein LOC129228639 n=1 Tax=Uloborus diversus TaxID=327109 RepID=UPI002409941D|nr:uncharacterized protein LOC129228639 [Uloborus diversus]
MLSKTVIFLFVCLSVIHGFRSKNFGSKPETSANEEENVYPCYRDVNCALGKEAKDKANECYDYLSKENLKLGIDWLEESSKMIISKKDREGAMEQFCEMEEAPRSGRKEKGPEWDLIVLSLEHKIAP